MVSSYVRIQTGYAVLAGEMCNSLPVHVLGWRNPVIKFEERKQERAVVISSLRKKLRSKSGCNGRRNSTLKVLVVTVKTRKLGGEKKKRKK